MTTQIEAMKNALDALGTCEDMLPNYHQWLSDAKHELRAAIEAAEKVEPDAVVVDLQSCFPSCAVVPVFPVGTLFYLHPPSAEIEELRNLLAGIQEVYGAVLSPQIHNSIDAAMEKQP